MKKITLKTNAKLFVLILFFTHLCAYSQSPLSVPFTDGFIGTKGSSVVQADNILTFATLGINKAYFMQYSVDATFHENSGNNVPGILRLQLISGQLIDIPGLMAWKNDNSVDYLGFIPDSGFSSVSFSYGVESTYTIYGGTTSTSNIGLGLIGKSTSDFVDGTNLTGNNSGFVDDLNSYLSTTKQESNLPAGSVTVVPLTTIDTTPTLTGTVSLFDGESLSIVVNNVMYTIANGLLINFGEGTWSLTIPNEDALLSLYAYSVEARITNVAGYILDDPSSSELYIESYGPPPTDESPVITYSGGDVSIQEGETFAPITFTVSDTETSTSDLLVTGSSSNTDFIPDANILISGELSSPNRTISLTPVGDSGSSTITIHVVDGLGNDATQTFVVYMAVSLVLNRYGKFVSDPTEAVDSYGGKGKGSGNNQFGKKIKKRKPLKIGDPYQGGIIAYFLVSGDPGYNARVQHGLIAATSDQSDGIQWHNGGNVTTGATGEALGTGLANTNTIITKQGATATNYAAGLARAYNGGDYTDWYLPSKDELNILYLNRVAIGGFTVDYYYSSSEIGYDATWIQGFQYDGDIMGIMKYSSQSVRAIRSF